MEILNFNRHRPPILPVEMMDNDSTVLHIVPPTLDLQEELRAKSSDLTALLTGGDEEKRTAMWDLAARLMSCNRNMKKVTPEDLRNVYRLDEEDLAYFFEEYVNFLKRLENAKN